jgi:hypothetical protein
LEVWEALQSQIKDPAAHPQQQRDEGQLVVQRRGALEQAARRRRLPVAHLVDQRDRRHRGPHAPLGRRQRGCVGAGHHQRAPGLGGRADRDGQEAAEAGMGVEEAPVAGQVLGLFFFGGGERSV